MSKNTPRKLIGSVFKLTMAFVVLAFLGLQSYNFFVFVFPPEQWYYAFLGFGLTSGGVVGYLIVFKTDADTDLKRTIAFAMMIVCVIGEVATAGFGMQVEAWQHMNMGMDSSEFNLMIWAIRILGFLHGAALLLYFAGDDIFNLFSINLFKDDDRDGIPNLFDRDYRKGSRLAPLPTSYPRTFPYDEKIEPQTQAPQVNPTQER